MATLDQKRARVAFEHVTFVDGLDPDDKERSKQKKYASIVHAMPALLRSAGLSQALHFVRSRKSEEQQLFLEHLAVQLARVDGTIKTGNDLLAAVRGAELSAYLRLTHEALACVVWYRRFVQGELRIEAGANDVG